MNRILVYEPTSRWTAELEKMLAGRGDTVRWRPHFADLLTDLHEQSPRLIVYVVCAPDDQALQQLRNLLRTGRPTRLLCLTSEPEATHWEWLARELGATSVLPDTLSPLQFREAVELLLGS
ncbi:hypothetical protein [Planctomicrobium sp. SH664]|uniref:hypothetical protein n=1 Tax=Planctomicrobium sp. SH664 TaxID=3448125 RepID=UPI003F5C7A9A